LFVYISRNKSSCCCQDYERPLLQMKSPLLSRHTVRVIFYKVKDILHCHSMFNIELAEHIRMWDEMEQLGNVFTASVGSHVFFLQLQQ